MERVAEPFPAFAWTTSVPPSWVLFVRASNSSGVKVTDGEAWSYFHNPKIQENWRKPGEEALENWQDKVGESQGNKRG